MFVHSAGNFYPPYLPQYVIKFLYPYTDPAFWIWTFQAMGNNNLSLLSA